MKNKDPKFLMVNVRKRLKRGKPKTGEVVQAIGYSFLNSIQNFKGAKALFDLQLPLLGFEHVITALEELGKLAALVDALLDSESGRKLDELKARQKSHPWKLGWALKMFSAILKNDSIALKIRLSVGDEKREGQEALEYLLRSVAPAAASHYHNLRINCGYTEFDGQRASSPHHNIDSIRLGNARLLAETLLPLMEEIANLLDRFVPLYYRPLKEGFEASDARKTSSLKRKLNRIVERTMPAVYFHIDRLFQEVHGIHLDEAVEKDIQIAMSEVSLAMILEHANAISELIQSDQIIPMEYFYPPLKEHIKQKLINEFEGARDLTR